MSAFNYLDFMATLSGPVLNSSGSKILPNGAVYSKMPFRFHRRDTNRFSKFHFQTTVAIASRRLTQNLSFQMLYLHNGSSATTHISSAGRNYELNYDDDSRTKPFWLNMIRDAIWNTRSLLLFITEQPSQLKYIEWPSVQSTLKTATLTLALVAMLIVALSSVDSALSCLLALILRRKA